MRNEKEQLMDLLGPHVHDVKERTERLFCLAILNEGSDAVARITGRFLQFRKTLDVVEPIREDENDLHIHPVECESCHDLVKEYHAVSRWDTKNLAFKHNGDEIKLCESCLFRMVSFVMQYKHYQSTFKDGDIFTPEMKELNKRASDLFTSKCKEEKR